MARPKKDDERVPLTNVGALNQAITDAFHKILADERESDGYVPPQVEQAEADAESLADEDEAAMSAGVE